MSILKTIKFNGKTFETKFYHELSDEEFEYIRKRHYEKPPKDAVLKQLVGIKNGKCATNLITKYYVKDLIEKTRKKKSKFSMEEVFSSKELVGFLYGKSLSNPKVYDSNDIVRNIETVCRIGGSGCVWSSASNFPIEAVDYIIGKYNQNGIVYDFSCGWGTRMLGAIRNNITYLGTDPNYELVSRLNAIATDYQSATGDTVKVDIRAHGSERIVRDWIGTVGLAFSSPPYFDEEDYMIGDQSYKDGMIYDEWLRTYYVPTIENIHQYLIDDGVFAINVKSMRGFDLESDTLWIARQEGFDLVATEKLKNRKRPHAQLGMVDNSENIYIFKKQRGHE